MMNNDHSHKLCLILIHGVGQQQCPQASPDRCLVFSDLFTTTLFSNTRRPSTGHPRAARVVSSHGHWLSVIIDRKFSGSHRPWIYCLGFSRVFWKEEHGTQDLKYLCCDAKPVMSVSYAIVYNTAVVKMNFWDMVAHFFIPHFKPGS